MWTQIQIFNFNSCYGTGHFHFKTKSFYDLRLFKSRIYICFFTIFATWGKLENQWFGNNLGSKMLYQMLLVSHQYRPHLPVPSASISIYLPEHFHWPPKLTLSRCRKQVVNAKELAPNQEQASGDDYPEHPLLSCLLKANLGVMFLYC